MNACTVQFLVLYSFLLNYLESLIIFACELMCSEYLIIDINPLMSIIWNEFQDLHLLYSTSNHCMKCIKVLLP